MATKAVLDILQGMLVSFGTSMATATREEQRSWWREDAAWRADDLDWRGEEKAVYEAESDCRQRLRKWHQEDIDQMNLENSRVLWLRFLEKNRRDVEEKTEQLKAISSISALFGLCATVTLTQLSLDKEGEPSAPTRPLLYCDLHPASLLSLASALLSRSPSSTWTTRGLIALYALTTALVEGLMVVSMVTCALLLGIILKIGKTFVSEREEQDFMAACLRFCALYQRGDRPPQPRKSFEAFWAARCEGSWQLAFQCCCLGVTAFLISMIAVGSYVQWAWGAYWRSSRQASENGGVQYSRSASLSSRALFLASSRRSLPAASAQPPGGFAGLPFDWHTAPHHLPI
ncbi:hypothetical protein CLOM_g15139 [Closterium sp. NIES-68]|nr:hypothetical protein CLOM_g15139 [Closterium sp. NIES-68]GJP58979.1 hypothetical protein CLOP_g6742 [Closterium sp. NIES-67]